MLLWIPPALATDCIEPGETSEAEKAAITYNETSFSRTLQASGLTRFKPELVEVARSGPNWRSVRTMPPFELYVDGEHHFLGCTTDKQAGAHVCGATFAERTNGSMVMVLKNPIINRTTIEKACGCTPGRGMAPEPIRLFWRLPSTFEGVIEVPFEAHTVQLQNAEPCADTP